MGDHKLGQKMIFPDFHFNELQNICFQNAQFVCCLVFFHRMIFFAEWHNFFPFILMSWKYIFMPKVMKERKKRRVVFVKLKQFPNFFVLSIGHGIVFTF